MGIMRTPPLAVLPDNDAVLFHRAKAVGEHFLTDACERLLQFFEPPWTIKKVADDQQFPFAADQLYGGGDRADWQFFFLYHDEQTSFLHIILDYNS